MSSVLASAAAPAALLADDESVGDEKRGRFEGAPAFHRARVARPVVISDLSGIRFKNGGAESAVERALRLVVEISAAPADPDRWLNVVRLLADDLGGAAIALTLEIPNIGESRLVYRHNLAWIRPTTR